MKNFKISQTVFGIILFFVFVLVVQVGMIMHENVTKIEAAHLGYEGSFCRAWGYLVFHSDKMQAAFDPFWKANTDAIRSRHYFPEKSKWDALLEIDKRDHAYIELSGLIFTFTFSLIGVIILILKRKSKETNAGLVFWGGIFLSLFIVKELFTSTAWILLGFMPCEHAKFSFYFKLPIMGTDLFLVGYSLLVSIIVLIYFVPRKRLVPFVVAGIPGGLTGIALWYFFIGRLVF